MDGYDGPPHGWPSIRLGVERLTHGSRQVAAFPGGPGPLRLRSNAENPIPMLTTTGGASFTVVLPDEQATLRLMVDVASALEPGDVLTLSGDLGAGKTTFARAMIRYLAGDETVEVPSPTFTLMQVYELPRFPVVHADLYRVSGSAELAELGFDDLPEDAVVVVEWPDRAAGFLPADRIDVDADAGAEAQARVPPCPRHRLRHVCAARRPHRLGAPVHRRSGLERSDARAHARRRLDPPLPPPDPRQPARHPDGRAAAAGRSAGARRQAVQPDRASRRDGGAVRRHGQGPARAGPDRARDPARRPAAGPARHRGPRQ